MAIQWPDGIHITEQKFTPFYRDARLLTTASGKAQPALSGDPVWRVSLTFGPNHNDMASTLMDALYGPSIGVMMPILKRLVPEDENWAVVGSGFVGADDEYYIDVTAISKKDFPIAGQMVAVGDSSDQQDVYRVSRVTGTRLFLAPKREARVTPSRMAPATVMQVRNPNAGAVGQWGRRTANWNTPFTVELEEVL